LIAVKIEGRSAMKSRKFSILLLFPKTIGATLMLIGIILHPSHIESAGWVLIVLGVCLILVGTALRLQRARARRKVILVNIRSV